MISKQIRKFQDAVNEWMLSCFGKQITQDHVERNYRFFEESIELVQSLGCSKEDALKLIDYVYDRPVGYPKQEVGGVMVTLSALCTAANIDLLQSANTELNRIWLNIVHIREKQRRKPIKSPLP